MLAVVLSVAVLGACTSAAPTPSPVPSTSVPPTPSPSLGPSAAVRRLVVVRPPPGGSLLVRGAYPRVDSACHRADRPVLRARYPGSLTAEIADDGTIGLTITLGFERYLQGIAEVPTSWPAAALDAQAIAARSYALASTGWTGEGETLEDPICSTTSCQVYRGIPVPPEPGFGRWVAAVRRTAGEILVYGGRPAETVYFSTSKGRTLGNDEVFGSAPLPYLRPVEETDDGASPTSRWTVAIPRRHLAVFLATAELWPTDTRIDRAARRGDLIVVRGGGETRELDVGEFRLAVNTWAPCLMPGRYPTLSARGTPLPVTIPSDWFSASERRGALVVEGRGWGHGVGMVQWGAYGKARRGLSAGDILAAYYGGLRPRPFPQPGVIDVEVASGLTTLTVLPSAEGARLDGEPLGSAPLVVTGGDGLTVTPG